MTCYYLNVEFQGQRVNIKYKIKYYALLQRVNVLELLVYSFLVFILKTFVTFCKKKKRVICVDRSVAQSVSYRFIITKTRFPSEVSQCGINGGQSDTGTGFSPNTCFSPAIVIS